MAGPGEFEIQLGHLCNDRCVFCKSGRLTHAGQAPVLAFETLAASIRDAYAKGHRRLTFVGGEPTIQPAFLELLRLSVSLGFENIVIFSNGSKAGRSDLVDRVLAAGGPVEWRFSVQGATREAHEATTGRKGGFAQVLRALSRVRARGQRATVNVCLVRQNCDSVDRFAELLMPLGVSQVHVDVVNPDDTGAERHELPEMMPRHADVAPALERMVRAFPEGFDVSIGSLPFCVAPALAPWIHHDHHPMWTACANDGAPVLKPVRFLARTNRKLKPERCGSCVFDERCTGVFGAYAERFGTDELRPVTLEQLAGLPTYRRLVALHLRAWLRSGLTDLAPWVARVDVEELNLREVILTIVARDGGELRVLLSDRRAGAVAASEGCALRVQSRTVERDAALEVLRELWSRLERSGMRTLVPPGEDALQSIHPSVVARLQRLRDRAPFGALTWTATRVLEGGHRVEVTLRAPAGDVATVWLAVARSSRRPKASGGYRVEPGSPSAALVEGLREVLGALGRGGDRAEPAAGGPRPSVSS
ncbi:MAG TPA: radical SAM protein [Polyangiaceae bacterium]|jgi:MoaA/NifB/PqqE/SkfB family radical SAM enzyme